MATETEKTFPVRLHDDESSKLIDKLDEEMGDSLEDEQGYAELSAMKRKLLVSDEPRLTLHEVQTLLTFAQHICDEQESKWGKAADEDYALRAKLADTGY